VDVTARAGAPTTSRRFGEYDSTEFYDEIFHPNGEPRSGSRLLVDRIEELGEGELIQRQLAAEAGLMNLGITFNVCGAQGMTERIFPFDLVPRIVEPEDWQVVSRGLAQRVMALNAFCDDIYHDGKILADGVVPEEIVRTAPGYLAQCEGLSPPRGIWCHITGSDLVRDSDGQFYVLEDNLRCPSGVSYVLENRQMLKRTFPQVFEESGVRAVEDYPSRLLEMLNWIAPIGVSSPTVAVLTPGVYNSAYFEHSFLAQQMGLELVEGRDLLVCDGRLCMRTTRGFQQIDVLYRRVGDDFLDPTAFRPESVLGVPGLLDVYRQGRLGLANAPGTGVADDKVVYAFVPQIIRYYLGEDIILPNVPTHLCWDEGQRAHVIANLDSLVVKPASESGGNGILIGPHATAAQRDEFARRIRANPRNYIAQPMLDLSRAPVIVGDHFEPRHVDLRPFVLLGEGPYVLPGGLTRVALERGSLVVSSSQGGGSKDTWVLTE
jgi:uncharacterized circularly permuted ATP-grasp superfamily protein